MDEHELYGVPREEFIPERNALAKALRVDGRREEAAGVAALRKPSVAAWTVNRLIRDEPDRFARLIEAGDALRAAQDRMLSGAGTTDELRRALSGERAAVEALLTAAARHGMSGAVSDRVAGTLHAAALDTAARDQVSRGELVEELQHVGFGDAPPVSREDIKRATRREQAEQAEQGRRAEERKRARHVEREARRCLEAAEKALESAEQRLARARAALREAEDSLDTAQAEAQAASVAHDRARRALDSQ
ncbi:MAG TPA: hypothetical protein VMF07_11870 [Solirubrobacteraceae bacterium]|nr:hypothetical protein [Solirubrobacteraceae bacterium]